MTGGEEWLGVNKTVLGRLCLTGQLEPRFHPTHGGMTFLWSGVLEKHSACLLRIILGLPGHKKGGIPHRFPSVTQEICAELVSRRHKHRERGKANVSQERLLKDPILPGSKGKSAGMERTTKGKSHKERSLGSLAKPDTEEQPQFWHPGMKTDISSTPILCR